MGFELTTGKTESFGRPPKPVLAAAGQEVGPRVPELVQPEKRGPLERVAPEVRRRPTPTAAAAAGSRPATSEEEPEEKWGRRQGEDETFPGKSQKSR